MMKLALAIAAGLVLASLQCVASCADFETAPPCHHHSQKDQTVGACSHEIVMDRAPEVVSAAPVAPPAAISCSVEAILFQAPVHEASFLAPPHLILRI